MRILLYGKNGQLGWELRRALSAQGEVVALDYPEIDFTQTTALRDATIGLRPDLVVNAAAYTAVDRAESEPEAARLVNAAAPGALAEAALDLRVPLIHYSTDYVFDGRKGAAYVEEDPTDPLNEYGRSKREGEKAVAAAGGAFLTLRTSWVYSTRQGGFVAKVREWARSQKVMRMVTDQVGSPTWTRALAEATAYLVAIAGRDRYTWFAERSGLYHLGGDGAASRFEWARAILDLDPGKAEQTVEELRPALTREFPTPAERPLRTPLDCSHFRETFGLRLPPWREALEMALEK